VLYPHRASLSRDGLHSVMMSCFSWQLKLVMMYRWEPERALQLIERHRVTTFVGVPTQSWTCSRVRTCQVRHVLAHRGGRGGRPRRPNWSRA